MQVWSLRTCRAMLRRPMRSHAWLYWPRRAELRLLETRTEMFCVAVTSMVELAAGPVALALPATIADAVKAMVTPMTTPLFFLGVMGTLPRPGRQRNFTVITDYIAPITASDALSEVARRSPLGDPPETPWLPVGVFSVTEDICGSLGEDSDQLHEVQEYAGNAMGDLSRAATEAQPGVTRGSRLGGSSSRGCMPNERPRRRRDVA